MKEADTFLVELFRAERDCALRRYRMEHPFMMEGCATMFIYGFSAWRKIPEHVGRAMDLLAMRYGRA